MSTIKVDIDKKKVSIWNNGKGIPIVIHKEHNVYVPELIFGQLLSSSNYDDSIKKVTGGRNGFGAKLTNVYSKKFIVETSDSKTKKYNLNSKFRNYIQTFSKNMSEKTSPEIKEKEGEDYTCITFYPDFKRFKMTEFDEDMISLMMKRVYDIGGSTSRNIKVYLNGKKIPISNFKEYVSLYLDDIKDENNKSLPKLYESPNDRWEICVSLADQFTQISFVNTICTMRGGTHVNYITEQVLID